MVEKTSKKKEREEPIYEKLDPNSCLIISKTENEVIYACNKDGQIVINRATIPSASKDLSPSVTVTKKEKDK